MVFYLIWLDCHMDKITAFCVDYIKLLPKVSYTKYYLTALAIIFGPSVILGNIINLVTITIGLKTIQSEVSSLQTNKNYKKQQYQSKRITVTLLLIVIVDTVLIIPGSIGLLYIDMQGLRTKTTIVYDQITEVLFAMRPVYNIILYLLTNKEYRSSFNQLILHRNLRKDNFIQNNYSCQNINQLEKKSTSYSSINNIIEHSHLTQLSQIYHV